MIVQRCRSLPLSLEGLDDPPESSRKPLEGKLSYHTDTKVTKPSVKLLLDTHINELLTELEGSRAAIAAQRQAALEEENQYRCVHNH